MEEDDVGPKSAPRRLDREPVDLVDAVREPRRPIVVLAESRKLVVERVQGRAGEDARLPHAAPEHLAESAGPLDESGAPDQGAPDRCSQSLGEADAGGVRAAKEVRGCVPAGGGRVEEPGAVDEPATVDVESL